MQPFTFALDVAALASRREYLNLDKWLADNVTNYGADFLRSVIRFLEQKMESEIATRLSDPAIENRTMPLNPNTITIILRFLRTKFVYHMLLRNIISDDALLALPCWTKMMLMHASKSATHASKSTLASCH